MQNDPRVQGLFEHAKNLPTIHLIQALLPEATELVEKDSFAFIFACVLDRGTKAEIIWTLPYYIKNKVAKFDPSFFANASIDELYDIFKSLPKRPRYLRAAPRTVKELSQIIINEYGGEAENLWRGRTASVLKRTLERIYGVGPGISAMTVLLLETTRGVYFDDFDHSTMDIKPDVNTTRVLYRLGLIDEEKSGLALEAARRINPEYPGAIDAPLWDIGRKWCKASLPYCGDCPVKTPCPFPKGEKGRTFKLTGVRVKQASESKPLAIKPETIPEYARIKDDGELNLEELDEFYLLIASFERDLRGFIKKKLGKGFEKRLSREIPPLILDWEKRRSADVRMGIQPEQELINYAGLADYIQIIRRYKRIFSENDDDLNEITTFFKILANQGRNPLMHSRTLTIQKYHTTRSAISFLRQWMKRMD